MLDTKFIINLEFANDKNDDRQNMSKLFLEILAIKTEIEQKKCFNKCKVNKSNVK